MTFVAKLMRVVRAVMRAHSATHAKMRIIKHFWPRRNSLGVVAPSTTHIATFKENCCANTRPIMSGEALYISYTSMALSIIRVNHEKILLIRHPALLQWHYVHEN
jgi:hypothetical protein